MPAPCLAGAQALRWSGERGPPQQRGLQQRHWAALRTRRRRPADELACRTLEPGRMLPGSGLLAFQPSAAGSGSVDLGHGDGIASVSDFLSGAPLPPQSGGGGGGGGAHALGPGTLAAARPAAGIPKETFQQLRQAVLTSLDLTDNAEHTVDYEDGSAELQEDIWLESCPSAKEVGKSVFETLRIDMAGKTRRVYVRRRDLIRAHGLQPRDLRRVDPSLSPTKVSPSVTIKEECVLLNIGGVRAVVTGDKCLLFEPGSPSSRKFLEIVMPKIQAAVAASQRRAMMKGLRLAGAGGAAAAAAAGAGAESGDEGDFYGGGAYEDERIFPFELEMLEGALMVATGKLDAELAAATRRVSSMLQKLPREITPVNLEELRRVKQLLVELESKAENMRDLLEELMDDEEEFIQLNLSSRPVREEKRKQRERERLEREMEREREREADRTMRIVDGLPAADALGSSSGAASSDAGKPTKRSDRIAQLRQRVGEDSSGGKGGDEEGEGGYQDAQDALEEMIEEEEEERELEEVEDLLEYYLQRAANTQSEAERLLAGARDLEESIGVSLSARRFEVNRLELLLSIASFAAALGAMVAGIFGMNLRSTLEMSVVGFWGTTGMIIAGSYWVFYAVYKYTKRKRIL
ncbi:Mg2+ transporter [Micractinium conductrix]|uniref:Magnesium transporter n=1 Tax=Micractinium conductrix TaxID=554055 RepID=A0A2P6VAX4_9CHLO|nr:Mg2+ transporter [Micractinium conductrix]|eukprot:PSC71249.1 Mg2+ transporter [Micractinium conductrix]